MTVAPRSNSSARSTARGRYIIRIAAILHNAVRHDARVLKEAASLKARGHDVRLFGLTPDEGDVFTFPNGILVHLAHRDLSAVIPRIQREDLTRGRESSYWTSFRPQGCLILIDVWAHFD